MSTPPRGGGRPQSARREGRPSSVAGPGTAASGEKRVEWSDACRGEGASSNNGSKLTTSGMQEQGKPVPNKVDVRTGCVNDQGSAVNKKQGREVSETSNIEILYEYLVCRGCFCVA
jgi:hypothetical protein